MAWDLVSYFIRNLGLHPEVKDCILERESLSQKVKVARGWGVLSCSLGVLHPGCEIIVAMDCSVVSPRPLRKVGWACVPHFQCFAGSRFANWYLLCL